MARRKSKHGKKIRKINMKAAVGAIKKIAKVRQKAAKKRYK
jgi:hypothetical protein